MFATENEKWCTAYIEKMDYKLIHPKERDTLEPRGICQKRRPAITEKIKEHALEEYSI